MPARRIARGKAIKRQPFIGNIKNIVALPEKPQKYSVRWGKPTVWIGPLP